MRVSIDTWFQDLLEIAAKEIATEEMKKLYGDDNYLDLVGKPSQWDLDFVFRVKEFNTYETKQDSIRISLGQTLKNLMEEK